MSHRFGCNEHLLEGCLPLSHLQCSAAPTSLLRLHLVHAEVQCNWTRKQAAVEGGLPHPSSINFNFPPDVSAPASPVQRSVDHRPSPVTPSRLAHCLHTASAYANRKKHPASRQSRLKHWRSRRPRRPPRPRRPLTSGPAQHTRVLWSVSSGRGASTAFHCFPLLNSEDAKPAQPWQKLEISKWPLDSRLNKGSDSSSD
ncbi:hypothetical protein TcWFU_008936 [Taenia crassiceps]|uniref:Uncharacterized protein n=1 Tax=Taenia crassiceps TaxID=6207 RepID=A0ABR4Q2E8_9CEST